MTSFRKNARSLCLALLVASGAGLSTASAGDVPVKVSTALTGVSLLAPQLEMPGLKRQRQVLKIVRGAQHNEGFWSSELREAVLWLFKPETSQHASQ